MVWSAKFWSAPGSVVRPGEPIIEIVGKHRFVVAWFPVSRLYRLQVGDAVTISTGGGEPCRQDHKGQRHCRRAAERIPEGIRAHRRNTMTRNERDHMGESSPVADSEPPSTGLPRVMCEAFLCGFEY